jgi:hypothetical protein
MAAVFCGTIKCELDSIIVLFEKFLFFFSIADHSWYWSAIISENEYCNLNENERIVVSKERIENIIICV